MEKSLDCWGMRFIVGGLDYGVKSGYGINHVNGVHSAFIYNGHSSLCSIRMILLSHKNVSKI